MWKPAAIAANGLVSMAVVVATNMGALPMYCLAITVPMMVVFIAIVTTPLDSDYTQG